MLILYRLFSIWKNHGLMNKFFYGLSWAYFLEKIITIQIILYFVSYIAGSNPTEL